MEIDIALLFMPESDIALFIEFAKAEPENTVIININTEITILRISFLPRIFLLYLLEWCIFL